jgi:DNA-binding transcriptional LysR family regulator
MRSHLGAPQGEVRVEQPPAHLDAQPQPVTRAVRVDALDPGDIVSHVLGLQLHTGAEVTGGEDDRLAADGHPAAVRGHAHWQAAAAGVGVAPLPQYIAAGDPRLVPVLPELVFRGRYWLALPREHARLARVRAVEKVLDDVVAARHEDLLGAP